jgi:hypothetical protein
VSDDKKKTGPPAQVIKIEKGWEDAVAQALAKPRPPGGWPDAGTPKKPRKKKKPA